MSKRVQVQPTMPVAILVAAVALSVTSTADASLAAVLLQTQHAQCAAKVATKQAYSQWLDQFADAARQVRRTVSGRSNDHVGLQINISNAGRDIFANHNVNIRLTKSGPSILTGDPVHVSPKSQQLIFATFVLPPPAM